jgi:hypothetical protein
VPFTNKRLLCDIARCDVWQFFFLYSRAISTWRQNDRSANQVDFVQVVAVKGKAATKVKGSVEFMVCDDHQCLPPRDWDFATAVGGM